MSYGAMHNRRDPEKDFYGCLYMLLFIFIGIPFVVVAFYYLVEWLRG